MELHRQFRSVDVFAFLFCSTITLGVIFLPFVAEEEIRSSWLKLIVAPIPYFILLWLIYKFTTKYEDYDFFGAVRQKLWVGFYWFVMLYFIIGTLISSVRFSTGLVDIVNIYLLANTPKWEILLVFFACTWLAVYYGIQAIARFATVFLLLEVSILFSIIVIGLFNEHFAWVYIPPVWTVDVTTFIRSTLSDVGRYGGIIPILAFIYYVKKDEPLWKPMNMALFTVMLIYVGISVVVLGVFGFEQSLLFRSPVTALVQSISTRTGLLERMDLFFLGFWIVSFYKMFIIHVWFIVFLCSRLWPSVKQWLLATIHITLIFIGALIIPEFVDEKWTLHNVNLFLYTLVLPSCLLIYLIMTNKQGRDI